MSKKSNTVRNLLLFSSMICLSGPVMAATAKSETNSPLQISDTALAPTGQSPALLISSALWTPPGPPVDSSNASEAAASEEIWQPHQGAVTQSAEASSVPPPGTLSVPETPAVQSQPVLPVVQGPVVQTSAAQTPAAEAPDAQAVISQAPVETASEKISAETPAKPAVVAVNKPQVIKDVQKLQSQQSQIDTLAKQNADLAAKLKSAGLDTSVPAPTDKQALNSLEGQIALLTTDNGILQDRLKAAPTNSSPAQQASTSHAVPVAPVGAYVKVEHIDPKIVALNVVKRDLKNDDDRLAAIAPASGGPVDKVVPLPGKDEPAVQEEPVVQHEAAAQQEPVGQHESSVQHEDSSSPAEASEIGRLKQRYEMSEAENARLGDMVKIEKDQCEAEKGKMQKLLFSTQSPDDQQRYITDLEHKLGESQQALAEQKRMYEQQIHALKSKHVKHESES